jgi:hypothetical protein
MSWLLEAYRDQRTYGSLAYLLLGLPLGTFGFVVTVTGFALGVGMAITLIGIPVLVATLVFVRAFSTLERRLAWSLLESPMPRRAPHGSLVPGVFWQRLRELVGQRRTWREVGFVLFRLPLGIAGFVSAVTIVSLMLGGFAQPILVAAGVDTQIGSWTIDTLPESLIYLPISILFLLVGPRLLLGVGTIFSRIATVFLGQVESGELKSAVTDSLARNGVTDAFVILDDLELRFGRGPYLTPTRIEAALLALESTGHVRQQRVGPQTMYQLQSPNPT